MRMLLALILLLSLAATPARAQTSKKLPPPLKLALVQAQCAGPPIGPCSTLTFATGAVVLKGGKEPGPTCPKTGKTTDSPAGTVTLTGVTRAGALLGPDTTLTAEVDYKTTFGPDPNTNCGLATLQIDTMSLTATLHCKKGRCTGTFLPIACLPPNCADVLVTTELSNVVVHDDAQQNLARPGTFITPAATDAQ
jgi:hypothetical protein